MVSGGVAAAPNNYAAHINLGTALAQKGQVDEAIVSFRKAIELDLKYAGAHANLGGALMTKGDLDGGIASFRKAIELDPKFAPARTGLARAERLAAAQEQLSAFLKGDFKPTSNNERLVLAELCKFKKLYRAAVGLYTDAFAADPRLADDLRTTFRYKATCSAALAAVGQGEGAAKHDDRERTRLRKQALDWLKADLIEVGKLLDSGPPQARPFIVQVLSHWQKNPDLASIRDAEVLAKLPVDEQQLFTQLWVDVESLLKRAETPIPKGEKK